jgi:hypothetical protein
VLLEQTGRIMPPPDGQADRHPVANGRDSLSQSHWPSAPRSPYT